MTRESGNYLLESKVTLLRGAAIICLEFEQSKRMLKMQVFQDTEGEIDRHCLTVGSWSWCDVTLNERNEEDLHE